MTDKEWKELCDWVKSLKIKKMSDYTCRLYDGKEISCDKAKEFIESVVCQYKDCIIGSNNND